MEGRDLYIRHVIFASDSLGGRKRCTDEFPELSTGTRLSLLQLSEPILTLQSGASLDRMFQQKIQTLFVGTPDISRFLGDGKNQVCCGEHSHLICRNSIDFFSLPGEI